MTDFLLLLGKLNLATGGAIALIWLLRRPLRTQFGAPIAYALWLLVPIAGLACLLPPRVAAPVPAVAVQMPAAPMIAQIARPPAVERMTDRSVEQSVPAHSAPSPSVPPAIATPATDYAMPDYAMLLFAAWVLGVGVMTLYLARLQARFHAAAKLGEAGPAVAGFFRPRIVIPSGFAEQFNAAEQAAILAHERAHLARQDARINALAALLRCLCWFNPLMHLGAGWLRIDQELACDAAAMTGQVSRRDYANALLKSQMTLTPLPLGCDWPGSEHPLTERIALLKRKRPGTGRRIAGVGLVLFAAAFAGFGAWAAQPAAPGKADVPHNQIALATAPRINTVPDQNTQSTPPTAEANPSGATKSAPVIKPVTATTQSTLSQIQEPEQKIDLALNEAVDAALAKAVADASGSLPDEAVARQMAANATAPAPAASAPAAAAQIGTAPRAQTEAAVKCLNGLGPDDCETLFEDSFRAHRAIRYCAAEFVRERLGNCAVGPLEAIEYLGANAAGDDVFSVKTQSETDTDIIPPPGPDGKIPPYCTSGRPPESTFQPQCSDGRRVGSAAVKVITRPDHAIILYTRPQVHAALQPPDGAFIPAVANTPAAPVSPVEALSNGRCQPITGAVTSVRPDPQLSGTDVVLGHAQRESVSGPVPSRNSIYSTGLSNPLIPKDGILVMLVPTGYLKNFSSLDGYVGQQVAIWPTADGAELERGHVVGELMGASQLQLLATALADPKKTWCYLSPVQREAAAPAPAAAATAVRPATPVPSAAPVQVAAAAPAAKQIPANGMTVNDVVAWLQSLGYSAHGGRTIGGKTSAPSYNVSTFFNDHPYSIQFHDCNNDRCTSLHFVYGMADQSPYSRRILTSGMLDDWNNTNSLIKIWGKANLASHVGGAIVFDVQLARGDTYEELNTALALWTAGVQRFYDFVETGTPPGAPAIRPEIAQDLRDARRLEIGMSMHANHFAALKKIEAAEAMPNQTPEEKLTVDQLKDRLTRDNSASSGDPYAYVAGELSPSQ